MQTNPPRRVRVFAPERVTAATALGLWCWHVATVAGVAHWYAMAAWPALMAITLGLRAWVRHVQPPSIKPDEAYVVTWRRWRRSRRS